MFKTYSELKISKTKKCVPCKIFSLTVSVLAYMAKKWVLEIFDRKFSNRNRVKMFQNIFRNASLEIVISFPTNFFGYLVIKFLSKWCFQTIDKIFLFEFKFSVQNVEKPGLSLDWPGRTPSPPKSSHPKIPYIPSCEVLVRLG